MTTVVLKLLDWLRPFFVAQGIDFEQLKAIVRVKLTMDNRRVRVSGGFGQQNADKPAKNSFVITLAIHTFFGLLVGILILTVDNVVSSMLVIFAYLMFMMAMTLITDFSSVILDSNDNTIVLTRPVADNTLLTARIVHVLSYLLSMMLALVFFPMIFTGYKYGLLAGVSFIVVSILATLLVVFLTNLLYLGLMRFTSEEKLRDVINYFQIALTLFFMGGYRLVSSFGSVSFLSNTAPVIKWWYYFLPPVWMAKTMETTASGVLGVGNMLGIGLTLVVPIAAILVMNKVFAPLFSQKIAGLDNATRTNSTDKIAQKNTTNWVSRLANIATTNATERGVFEFVWKMTARDRKFKLTVYPGLAYFLLIFPLSFLGNGSTRSLSNIGESSLYIFFIYATALTGSTVRNAAVYSDQFKAAWIYQIIPIEHPAQVLTGTFKSLFLHFVAPIYLVLSVLIIALWGPSVIDDLIYGFFVNLSIDLVSCLLFDKKPPFSVEASSASKGGNFARGLMFAIILLGAGLFHWALSNVSYVITGMIPFVALLAYAFYRRYAKVTF